MKLMHYEEIEAVPVDMDGAAGCHIRCLIGPEDGAPSFSMRQFDVGPGGHTPLHRHAHEHEVFVLEGTGIVRENETERPLKPGTVVLVPPNQLHQFRNIGTTPMKFLCLVPHPLGHMNGSCAAACGCD